MLLQDGRVTNEKDLSTHLSASSIPQILERFSSTPKKDLNQAPVSYPGKAPLPICSFLKSNGSGCGRKIVISQSTDTKKWPKGLRMTCSCDYLCWQYHFPNSHCFHSILSLVESIRLKPWLSTSSFSWDPDWWLLPRRWTWHGIVREWKKKNRSFSNPSHPNFILSSHHTFWRLRFWTKTKLNEWDQDIFFSNQSIMGS